MRHGKRIVAWCLMLGLLFALLPPAPARAEGADWPAEADISWYTEGGQEYEISTPQALAGLAQLVNAGNDFSGETVTLGANVDLSGKIWTPIGTGGKAFCGTFDGKGHRVKGMDVQLAGADVYAGLFGLVQTGEIKNLMVQGTCSVLDAGNNLHAGGLVGEIGTRGKIKNCSAGVTVAVSATKKQIKHYAGGLAGYCSLGTLSNCFSTGTVTAENVTNAGGLLGKNDGTVDNCHFLSGSYAGGIGAGDGTALPFTAEAAGELVEALNTWADANGYLT